MFPGWKRSQISSGTLSNAVSERDNGETVRGSSASTKHHGRTPAHSSSQGKQQFCYEQREAKTDLNASAIPFFSDIGSVSPAFKLSTLQHNAFFMAASALPEKIAAGYAESAPSSSSSSKPCITYLGRERRMGITRVVVATRFLATKWMFPCAVQTCVPTGIAASLAQGQTFHSLVELRGGAFFNVTKKPSAKSVEERFGY